MISFLLTIAFLVVIGAFAWRRWHHRSEMRKLPGRSPESAIPAHDYSDIDSVLSIENCPCGGRFVLRGEGPLRRGPVSIRMTRLECRRCARERVLYFDLKK